MSEGERVQARKLLTEIGYGRVAYVPEPLAINSYGV